MALCLLAVLALPGVKSEAAAKKPTCVKKQTVYLARMNSPYNKSYEHFTTNSNAISLEKFKLKR